MAKETLKDLRAKVEELEAEIHRFHNSDEYWAVEETKWSELNEALSAELELLKDRDAATGSHCQVLIHPVNTMGEWLAAALEKLMEKGRDLETLALLEKLAEPGMAKVATEAMELHELLY